MKSIRTALILTCLVAGVATSETPLYADPIVVGTIVIDIDDNSPERDDMGNIVKNGVKFVSHYELNNAFPSQNCCNQADLRWIQRLILDKPAAPLTPPLPPPPAPQIPRPFIDPRQGQMLDIGIGDNLPFYDLTFLTEEDMNSGNLAPGGSGKFLEDIPQLPVGLGPITFTAETLLVCPDPLHAMKLGILGGVRWGFTMDAAGMVTVTPVQEFTEAMQPMLAVDFNNALNIDFPNWSLETASQAWPPPSPNYPIVASPEPATLLLVGPVIVVLAAKLRPWRTCRYSELKKE